MRIRIDDPADPRLDDVRHLNRSDNRPDLPGGKGLVIAEGLNEAQAHLRADRASNAARREALERLADERAREQEQQEINRKNELLRQATLLGLAN